MRMPSQKERSQQPSLTGAYGKGQNNSTRRTLLPVSQKLWWSTESVSIEDFEGQPHKMTSTRIACSHRGGSFADMGS